jgi:hypothetical protein
MKEITGVRHALISVVLTGLSSLTIAQPIITDVAYTEGNEITVRGTDFGEAPKVVFFENFENTSFTDKLSLLATGNIPLGRIAEKEADGNYVHQAKDHSKAALGRRADAPITVLFGKHYTEAFISFSVKVPEGTNFAGAASEKIFPTVSSWKFAWLMSTGRGFDDPTKFDVCLPTHVGKGSFSLAGNSGSLGSINRGVEWWEWDNFNHMTSYVRIDPSAPREEPIEYFWSVTNNLTVLKREGRAPASNFSKTDYQFDRVLIPGWWGNGDNSNFNGLYDNIYVAVGENSLARIVITDNEKIINSSFSITIPAKEWKNEEIKLDLSNLPKGLNHFIHVYDRNGKVSSWSTKICPTCPKAPGV